jgi:hypothetical protein
LHGHIKEDEMAKACCMNGGVQKCIMGFGVQLEGKKPLEDLGIKRWITVKLILTETEWEGMD